MEIRNIPQRHIIPHIIPIQSYIHLKHNFIFARQTTVVCTKHKLLPLYNPIHFQQVQSYNIQLHYNQLCRENQFRPLHKTQTNSKTHIHHLASPYCTLHFCLTLCQAQSHVNSSAPRCPLSSPVMLPYLKPHLSTSPQSPARRNPQTYPYRMSASPYAARSIILYWHHPISFEQTLQLQCLSYSLHISSATIPAQFHRKITCCNLSLSLWKSISLSQQILLWYCPYIVYLPFVDLLCLRLSGQFNLSWANCDVTDRDEGVNYTSSIIIPIWDLFASPLVICL